VYKKINQLLEKNNFSGSIVIKTKDQVVYHQAFGYRDRANQIENRTDTAFGIASGTKTFTALGILKLIDQGRLTLDSKLFDYIERPYESYDKEVTLRQVLSHLSGLPDYYDEDLIEDFDNFTIDKPWHQLLKPSDYYSSMPDRPMKHKPNTVFHYNNGAYVFLAMVIEKLTGDYHQFIKDQIIDPLKLNHTGFYKLDALPANTALGYIEEASAWRTNIYSLPIIGGGDGGLFTTTGDLVTLFDNLSNYKILSKDLTDQMLKDQTPETSDDAYGYGLWIDDHRACMEGADAGVSFFTSYDPDKDLFYGLVSNTSHGVWDVLKDLKVLIQDL